ncbi:MAG: hydantoinase B/oxoprolinase family protein [Chloroflexota bacterium]
MPDPITIQVIRNALIAAAKEMQTTLVKTAHNPLIYEVQDFGVAMTNAKGELIAEGSGLPGFLACIPPSIQAGMAQIGRANLREGDVIITNEPYDTGTHISDTLVYTPVFYEEELVAFTAIMAHWADIGGMVSSGWCPFSTTIHQEGMIFSHLKLYDAGKLNEPLYNMILKNVRYPSIVEGDLHAKIAACHTGARRVQALCAKYTPRTIDEAMQIAFDQAEKRMRREIAAIPDGTYQAETYMDYDGVIRDTLRKIAVTVTIVGDEMHVDWTGTCEATVGPINHPLVGTEALCVTMLKSLTMPDDPMNHGHYRPLTVTAPPNTMVSAEYPAPCDSYGYVAEMIIHLVIRALSEVIPERCPACSYQMSAFQFYRNDPRHGRPFTYGEPLDGGGGAFHTDDGATGIMFLGNGDAPNVPVEVVETRYPVRVTQYAINVGSAGIGKYRGGFGVIRDYEMVEDNILIQTSNENTQYPPWGLHGGGGSGASSFVYWHGTEREVETTDRDSDFGPFHAGDRIRFLTTGGGGWGKPEERNPKMIENDLRNGLISAEDAERLYGYRTDV